MSIDLAHRPAPTLPDGPAVVLVPAYEPDQRLVDLIDALIVDEPGRPIVVVDDGSGPAYAPVFAAAARRGCVVAAHPVNRGKGAALKTGFNLVAERYPGRDVVCVDCDGQHRPHDVGRVAAAVRTHRRGSVLGVRAFTGEVPLRSRFGNTMTRRVFRLATGLDVSDTQTGLRGYAAPLIGWLVGVPGDRFEYELEVLLDGRRRGHDILEVPIDTVYLDDNESSHFRTVQDSIRVYVPFVKFSLSSIVSFALDAATLFVLFALTGSLVFSVIVARLLSGTVNYLANRRLVFRSGVDHRDAGRRYVLLAAALLVANYALLRGLTTAGLDLVPAKLATELSLFVASFRIQRRRVFAGARGPADDVAAAECVLVGATTDGGTSPDVPSTG